MPPLHAPFAKQLYATYLSFLPQEALRRSQTMHQDPRGSFTELFRTASHGQLSVSLTRPGIVRGNHWHRTKAETFWVVQGEGVIRLKKSHGGGVLLSGLRAGDDRHRHPAGLCPYHRKPGQHRSGHTAVGQRML